ncbi:hypothetical protein BDQ17DRAFT_1393351 [Cyathus striatus]|nr:hypothetical protein BDQ17DRAFT_1393351 [Cyathus striatus]
MAEPSTSSSSGALTSANFEQVTAQLQSSVLKATRTSAGLPLDIVFHRSIDPAFANDVDKVTSRVLGLTNKLLGLAGTVNVGAGKGKKRLESEDDVLDRFQSIVVDVVDQMFERTDTCLDEFLGRIKAPAIAVNPIETSKKTLKPTVKGGFLEPGLQHASTLRKPQLNFKKKPENNDSPWIPGLKHKFNAKVPLGSALVDVGEDENKLMTSHPYYYEITHFSPTASFYTSVSPIPAKEMEETPFTWVNTPIALQELVSKLKMAKEIAVDLEHHSYRSYAGFLCLMQISTRAEDFVVDLLADGVREEMAGLGEVFSDPGIVKVFHGAESDITWLQQDFDLYIVNLFDTFHASKLLDFPRHGLANLLEMYCDFIPDKRYQLADWRIRPLPEEMLQYARSDTHFLLYIYDNLRNALLDRGTSTRSRSGSSTPTPSHSPSPPPQIPFPSIPLPNLKNPLDRTHRLINLVLARSAETSLRVYQKDIYDHERGAGTGGWDTLARKWNKPWMTAGEEGVVGIQRMQREVYKAVHWWRERVAREEDESTRFVLPTHFLFQLGEQPPADMPALLQIFRTNVPPVLKRRAKELLDAIQDAVKRSLEETNKGVDGMKEDEELESKQEGTNGDSDAVMEEEEAPKEVSKSTQLWRRVGPSSLAATSSSLLGKKSTTQPVASSNSPFAASTSSLFGKVTTRLSGSSGGNAKVVDPKFQELVARISSTFVIAPSAPKVVSTTTTSMDVKEEATMQLDPALGMQVEVPFVPSAQRKVTKVEETDTIVVVGQARQKKRKREDKSKAQSDEEEVEQPAFDFSSVPNLLDDNPNAEGDQGRKKRQRKAGTKGVKGGQFYGDFPAPPRAYNEVKSGNQSHTFRK